MLKVNILISYHFNFLHDKITGDFRLASIYNLYIPGLPMTLSQPCLYYFEANRRSSLECYSKVFPKKKKKGKKEEKKQYLGKPSLKHLHGALLGANVKGNSAAGNAT